MKKIALSLIMATAVAAPCTGAPCTAQQSLEKAQWCALKSCSYTAGYFVCKHFFPGTLSRLGFRDEFISFFVPVNAANATACMAAWNAVKAAVHYRLYKMKQEKKNQNH